MVHISASQIYTHYINPVSFETIFEISILFIQGSLNYPFGEMKHYKCIVNLKDFRFNSALFGVVI